MPQEREGLEVYTDGVEGSADASVPNLQLPSLAVAAAGLESKESRREVLSRLDRLLEQLELANLAELSGPPVGLVRQLRAQGLPNPVRYTISELMEIIFNSQRPLMRANREGFWSSLPFDEDDTDRQLEPRWASNGLWSAAVS
jgi:hypothetical protein